MNACLAQMRKEVKLNFDQICGSADLHWVAPSIHALLAVTKTVEPWLASANTAFKCWNVQERMRCIVRKAVLLWIKGPFHCA